MTSAPEYRSVRLDPAFHVLSEFRSGEDALDVWLRESAASAARARVAQTCVWTEGASPHVVAYFAISAHAISRAEAPSRIARGVPDPVPAALIGKLALDRTLSGKQLGDVLLADALERVIAASEAGPAVRAIVVDASTERGRALDSRFGFVPVPGRHDRMIVRAQTIAAGLA